MTSSIAFIRVSGHTGVEGNEMTDELAKMGLERLFSTIRARLKEWMMREA